jgi:uncharacterized protein (DUF362 family)
MPHSRMTRRDFFKRAAALGLAAYGLAEGGWELLGEGSAEAAARPTIVVAAKRDPAALVRAAVDGLGGMKKFVKQGAVVLVKPNMGWVRKPEQAANTNPEVVAEVVRLCRAAGAREVKVVDNPVDRPASLIASVSGIAAAAEAAGAKVTIASSPALFQRTDLKRSKVLKSAEVLRDLLRADVFINLPIVKVHGSTVVTLACKNLMGTVSDRGAWHNSASLDQCIADYAAQMRPHLVVMDAVRILTTNGPKGPGRVKELGIVAAGTDALALDAYGTMLLGKRAQDVGHLRLAYEMGVGEIDLKRVTIRNV